MNYPDDVRQYDHNPLSPFYSPPCCPCCGEEAIEERDGELWCPVCDEEDDDEG